MNKEVSNILKNWLRPLPFVDVLAGLVQTAEVVEYQDGDERVVSFRKRFPISYDVDAGAGSECLSTEKNLQPDSQKKSIIYFEDFGSRIDKTQNGLTDFTSQIRLVCWLNRNLLTGNAYSEITAFCIAAIIPKLCRVNPVNIENFISLKVKAGGIPIQGPEIFSRYTYDETVRQYLRPPFEAFAIDLNVNYQISSNCINQIDFNTETLC